jgi:nitrogen fixation-related uncharacterized protein
LENFSYKFRNWLRCQAIRAFAIYCLISVLLFFFVLASALVWVSKGKRYLSDSVNDTERSLLHDDDDDDDDKNNT